MNKDVQDAVEDAHFTVPISESSVHSIHSALLRIKPLIKPWRVRTLKAEWGWEILKRPGRS